MRAIRFSDFTGYLAPAHQGGYKITQLNWQVNEGEHWLLVGANGAGKSALTAAMAGYASCESGTINDTFKAIEIVSSEVQKQLLAQELERDTPTFINDFLFPDNTDNVDIALTKQLLYLFDFSHLLPRQFRDLSTGETRKLLLIRALSRHPKLLILDEPFDGLDQSTMQTLHTLLTSLSARITFVFVLNRLAQIPDFVSHYGYVAHGQLQHCLAHPTTEQRHDFLKLLHLQHTSLTLPERDPTQQQQQYTNSRLVKLNAVSVTYGGRNIFANLSWQINQHQHWQLVGKNGSGKTCLLNLITGDNPQCYNNDIQVFGFQRGSGESIWDIKQHIGYISNALHLDYRVSVSALNTVISGFYDSIGLYQKPTDEQIMVAKKWLALLGLAEKQSMSFTQLSYGDQRMLLIARAMVKHPTLLILDEPCLGLDEPNRQRVLLLIEKICAAKSSTVIYVNHHNEDKIEGIEHCLAMEDYHLA